MASLKKAMEIYSKKLAIQGVNFSFSVELLVWAL